MARGPLDNTNQFDISTFPITSLPISFSAWIYSSSFSGSYAIRIQHSTTFHEFGLLLQSGGNVIAQTRNSLSGISNSSGGSSVTADTWTQVGGIWRSGDDWRNHYVNGSPGTANTETRAVTQTSPFADIGPFAASTGLRVADLAVWDADIGVAGMASLGAGSQTIMKVDQTSYPYTLGFSYGT